MNLSNLSKNGLFLAIAFFAVSTASSAPIYTSKELPADISDNDKDGVINVRDFCPDTPSEASIDNDGCPSQNTIALSADLKVSFDSNRYEVKPIYYPEIKKIADFLKQNPSTSVVIKGHTDSIGDDDFNLRLSQDRANAISDVLVQKFRISGDRVKSIGYGEQQPVASNETPEGREQNRRVVAEVFTQRTEERKRWNIFSAE